MIDTVASILAPLLSVSGGAGGDAAVLPPAPPPAGSKSLATRPGKLPPVFIPTVQFSAVPVIQPLPEPTLKTKRDKPRDDRQLAFDFANDDAPLQLPAFLQAAAQEPPPQPSPAGDTSVNTRADVEAAPPVTPDTAVIEGRRRPGFQKDLPSASSR